MTSISVVIISKNERGLAETLKAVLPQCTTASAELLVVDASEGALDDIARQCPAVRWIPFASSRKKAITIPEQRNAGVRAAAGDVVVFTDSGCIPDDNWLTHLTEPIVAGEEVIVIGGVYSRRAMTVYDSSAVDSGADKVYVDECPTINLAFRKEAFVRVGGFDEHFDYGSDVDISWRWIDAGLRIRKVRGAAVGADWGKGKRQIKRSFLWGAARARLYVKHRNRRRQIFRRDPIAVAYPMFLLGLPLALFFPYYLLLLAIPLWTNRQRGPVPVVAEHLVYGVGVLWHLGRDWFR